MKKYLLLGYFYCLFTVEKAIAAQLPSYASGGNLQGDLESKGQTITEILSLIGLILAIITIVIGGIKIGTGDAEGGKRLLIGGLIGIVIIGSVYGIAGLVA